MNQALIGIALIVLYAVSKILYLVIFRDRPEVFWSSLFSDGSIEINPDLRYLIRTALVLATNRSVPC